MRPAEFLRFLHTAEKLKCNTRHSWTSTGRNETVAGHAWRLSLMALLLGEELPGADMDRVLRMALVHDLGEAVTGDVPSFEKTAEDEAEERQAAAVLFARLPEPQRGELAGLIAEFEAQSTPEAKACRALDKLEAVIQHNEAPLDSWLELEYDLQRSYGLEEAAPFPFLRDLRALALRDTEEKIKTKDGA